MEVLKEIIGRLDTDRCTVCLYDCKDDSRVLIDSKLRSLIRIYYEDLLMQKAQEAESNG